ncbi:MAG: hypothetical protein ACIARR_06700 [Phycisphaerales bacterium JB059]
MSSITRRVFAVTVLLAMSVFLTGCGASPFEGTWTLDKEATRVIVKSAMESKMSEQAGEQGAAALEMMKGMLDGMVDQMMEDMDATLTINADGTFVAKGDFGNQPELNGTWTEKDGTATFDATGEDNDAVATLEGEKLRFAPKNKPADMPQDFALIFKKSE